jgi:hypothetical protein
MRALTNNPWPRNIRQLRSCIETAVGTYPGLEHLVLHHLELSTAPATDEASARASQRDQVPVRQDAARTVQQLVDALDAFAFDDLPDSALDAQLPVLEAACARLLIRYLREGLVRHKRPDGRQFVQPAMKFMTGDRMLHATKAYDGIKRLLHRDKKTSEALLEDPILKEVYDKSVQGRPKPKKDTEP